MASYSARVLVPALFITWLALASATCEKRRSPPARKPRIVLVHGFRAAGFSGFRERFLLENAGYDVTAVDLRASGIDMTPITEVNTFEDYNEPLDRFMAGLPEGEKVVLVGGSAGGISVTKVLNEHPEKVWVALYMSATMIKEGIVSCADLEMGVPGFTQGKCHASCPTLPHPTCFEQASYETTELPLEQQSQLYTLGKLMRRPGPLRAVVTANFTEAARKGGSRVDRVPRVYVKTLLDPVLVPWQQDAMIKRWPPCEVIQVKAGHGIDNPDLIAAIIMNVTMYAPPRF